VEETKLKNEEQKYAGIREDMEYNRDGIRSKAKWRGIQLEIKTRRN
jgi:hypothetical protein